MKEVTLNLQLRVKLAVDEYDKLATLVSKLEVIDNEEPTKIKEAEITDYEVIDSD